MSSYVMWTLSAEQLALTSLGLFATEMEIVPLS